MADPLALLERVHDRRARVGFLMSGWGDECRAVDLRRLEVANDQYEAALRAYLEALSTTFPELLTYDFAVVNGTPVAR